MTKKQAKSEKNQELIPDQENLSPNPASESPRKGEDFGLEGTNKTVPFPLPNAEPAAELQGTKSKFIPKSPYTRG